MSQTLRYGLTTLEEGRVDMYKHKCIIAACGSDYARKEKRDRVYQMGDGEHILVYGVPVTVCVNCGELTFSIDDVDKIGELLHEENGHKPARQVVIPAIEFARLELTTEDLLLTTNN